MEFKKENFMDKYPIEYVEVLKDKINTKSIDEVINKIEKKIENHNIAKFISIFDNYNHTKSLNGFIKENILAAKIVIFCFGKSIDSELLVAARPRNIGIVETADKFIISFMQAPNEQLNQVIKNWLEEVFENE